MRPPLDICAVTRQTKVQLIEKVMEQDRMIRLLHAELLNNRRVIEEQTEAIGRLLECAVEADRAAASTEDLANV